MQNYFTQQNKYIISSVMLHCLIIIAASVYFHFSSSIYEGQKESLIISAYSLPNKFMSPQTQQKSLANNTNITTKSVDAIALSTKKNREKTSESEKKMATQQAVLPAGSRSGDQQNELLALLHEAIQKQQQYPLSAQQMERKGRTTIQFTLATNGSVSNLKIAKSSGTNSLDEAAMAAVRDASPFQHIEKYIQNSQEYAIDVVFDEA